MATFNIACKKINPTATRLAIMIFLSTAGLHSLSEKVKSFFIIININQERNERIVNAAAAR